MRIRLDKKLITIGLIFIISLFINCLTTNYDFDLFARLDVGEHFLKTLQIWKKDPFSYTPTHLWYDHEWGSGVIFYAFLKMFGPFGLILLKTILLTTTLYFINKLYPSKNFLLKAIFFLFALFLVDDSLIRCQTFSYLFFALFIYIIEKYRQTNSNKIYLLPLLTIIWNNLHGGVVSGLGICTIYCLGLLFFKKPCKKLIVSNILSILSLIINPYGIKYISFILFATTLNRYYITEWYDVFQKIFIYYSLPVLLLISILIILKIYSDFRNKKFDYIQYTIIAVTAVEGILHFKLLSLLLIAVFCYCPFPEFKKSKQIETILSYVIIILFFFIPLSSPNVARATFGEYPLQEIEFIKINNINGNIIVSFELGSYAIYKLYPNNLVYMDGRYEEVYPLELLDKLYAFYNGRDNWKDLLKEYPPDIIICDRVDKLHSLLSKETEWINVYKGFYGDVFIKKINLKESYNLPSNDILYYRKNLLKY